MKKNNKNPKLDSVPVQSNEINLKDIIVTYNPRKYFDEKALNELAESIKNIGVIQPITVRPVKNNAAKYELICGERRFKACKMAKKTTIPAYIRECSDDERIEMAFVENIQREDVREIEIAEAIKGLLDAGKEDFESIAIRLGKSIKYVRDRYKLNALIDEIKELVNNSSLSVAKAVLLSSYEEELQRKVFENHLLDQYSNLLDISYSKFEGFLNRNFNTNLSTAKFDLSECQNCPFNSAVNSLFVEDENKKCLKKDCFIAKQQTFVLQKAIAQIEENPNYMIIKHYSDNWFMKALEEEGFEISNVSFENYPTEPELPEKPQKADYIDEETKKLDQQEWITAQRDYEDELETYKQNLEEYKKEIAEIEDKITQGQIERCYVIKGTHISTEIRYLSEEEANNEDASSQEKAALEKLIKQDKRNNEIKIENSVREIKEILFPNDKHFTEAAANKAEQDMFFYYILGALSRDTLVQFFNGEFPSENERFEFITKITPQQRISIIRSFIVSKLREYAHNSTSISTQFLLEFAKMHKEKETLEILAKYQSIYDKRKESIEAKKKELQKDEVIKEKLG